MIDSMAKRLKLGFENEGVELPIDSILPTKKLSKGIIHSRKFQTIRASVEEIGLIQPLVVFPSKKEKGVVTEAILLDGHIRLEILRSLGKTEVFCLISKDDEGFSYGDKVNRLSPIQEHFMIRRAIKLGVSEKRIAKTLNVDVSRIRQKKNMLKGICPEAVELLKDRDITSGALAALRKVKPIRQVEIAELMVGLSTFTMAYANALVIASKPEDLVEKSRRRRSDELKPEDLAKMRKEMDSLQKDIKEIQVAYETTVLDLTFALGYLKRILNNGRVVRFLSSSHKEILDEFTRIIESSPLEG